MESKLPLALAAFAAAFTASLHAEETAPRPPEKAPAPKRERTPEEQRDREQRETLEHLRRLVSMSDAQIGRMRATLDNVEKIPAERRVELRRKIEALRNGTPEQREQFIRELREKNGLFEEPRNRGDKSEKPGKNEKGEDARRAGIRTLLDKHFNTLPPAEAKTEKEKFLAMPREEKMAYLRALREKYGLPPEPPREPRKGDERPKAPVTSAPSTPPPPGDPFRA